MESIYNKSWDFYLIAWTIQIVLQIAMYKIIFKQKKEFKK